MVNFYFALELVDPCYGMKGEWKDLAIEIKIISFEFITLTKEFLDSLLCLCIVTWLPETINVPW